MLSAWYSLSLPVIWQFDLLWGPKALPSSVHLVFLISHWPLLSDPIPLLWLPTLTLFLKWSILSMMFSTEVNWLFCLFVSVCVFSCCEHLNSGQWLLDTSLPAWPTSDNLCSCVSPRNPDLLLPQGWWTSQSSLVCWKRGKEQQEVIKYNDEVQNEIDRLNKQPNKENLKVEQKCRLLHQFFFLEEVRIDCQNPKLWVATFVRHPQWLPCSGEDYKQVLYYLSRVEMTEFEDIKLGYRIDLILMIILPLKMKFSAKNFIWMRVSGDPS